MTVRRPLAVLATLATALLASAASVVFATPSAAAGCTDSWIGPSTGVSAWSTAGNWSNGVPDYYSQAPHQNGHVCITKAGTYTIRITSDVKVNSLQLGAASGTQTLAVAPTTGGVRLDLTEPSAISSHGVLQLTPTAKWVADLSGGVDTGGGGSLAVGSGGRLATSGASDATDAYVDLPVTTAAGSVVSFAAPSSFLRFNAPLTNSGSVSVAAGAALDLTSGASFTAKAGTLAVLGQMTVTDGAFTAAGGTGSGHPVRISSSTLNDSAGAGSFDIVDSSTLYGDVPAGQTVTVRPTTADVALTVPGNTSVSGTLALRPSSAGYAIAASSNGNGSLSVARGGVLSTRGPAGARLALVDIPVHNAVGGLLSLGASSVMRYGAQVTNAGTVAVLAGGHLDMSGTTLTTKAGSTLGVTVDAASHTAFGISGAVTAAGTLQVTTVGTPKTGSTFDPLTGPVSGRCGQYSFGPHAYAVSYPGGTVHLTTRRTFTVTATSFSPRKGVATGPTKVGTVGDASTGTGTYSATIDWGDGSARQAAKVSGGGDTRTVTAPSHTYTTRGTFTVTIVVQNENGTEVGASRTVTVEP